jgi:Uma2 family endonuclease
MLSYSEKEALPAMSECLRNGDSMGQKQFHNLYEQMPEGYRAELLNGVVFVSEPLGMPHGKKHLRLASIFDAYQASTPGVECCDNATVILGKKDEVQPDLFMRIMPEHSGQSQDFQGGERGPYVKGAPELVAEIASSTRAIDMHIKRRRYKAAGVIEYIIFCLQPLSISWFDLRTDHMFEADTDGIYRSVVFLGLWVHGNGLLKMDYKLVMDVLQRGLASAAHKKFVAALTEARR